MWNERACKTCMIEFAFFGSRSLYFVPGTRRAGECRDSGTGRDDGKGDVCARGMSVDRKAGVSYTHTCGDTATVSLKWQEHTCSFDMGVSQVP